MFVVCVFFLLMEKNTYALTSCYENEEIANGALSVFKQLCDTSFGGGASFYGSVVYKAECMESSGLILEDRFQVTYSCNTCTAKNIKKDVEDFKNSCAEQCRLTDYVCSFTNGEWGHSFPLPKICGKTDSTLSGCSESSSSSEESSSSGNSSSSSGESSSSGFGEEESSDSGSGSLSSGGGTPSSSGSGCSGEYCDVANAPQGEFGFVDKVYPCGKSGYYIAGRGSCAALGDMPKQGTVAFMNKIPSFVGDGGKVQSDYCENPTTLKIVSEMPVILRNLSDPFVTEYICYSDEISNSLSENACFEYTPKELCDNRNRFCSDTIKVLQSGKYYCNDVISLYNTGTKDGCTASRNFNVFSLDSSGRLSCTSEYTGFACEVPGNIWNVWNKDSLLRLVRWCQYYKYSSSSESSDMASSSESEEVSSSSAFHDFSSASEGNYSSGFEMTSSSISIGSSSMGNFGNSSSSFSEEASSASGGYVSSSSKAEGFESETFVAGEKQIYSPEQVFNDGLRNMEIGKCYSLNPERGIQFGWINDNAQDSWWWMEVPCDGSVPLIETTSAGCYENRRGPTAIYLPGDCFSGGLDNMETGKCYALNPDRGAQYGWINNNAQDSYWWVEVPCEADDSEDELVCPENEIFFKRNEPLETSEDSVETLGESVVGLYDALGRKQKHRNVFGKRNAFYARKAHRDRRTVREFFENWSVSFKTVSGYVEAKTELGFRNVHFDCVSQTKTIIVADLYMKTPKDSIDKVVDSDDERLLAHENRHEEIYLLEGNDEWKEKISVNRNRLTEKNSCYIVKKTFWPVMEKRYRKMLEIQNAWDDEDKNNASHARINIDSLVVLQKIKWNAEPCYKENSK